MEKKFSVKEFFKSTAFKCIYVLLAIVLVCGVLLAFCNDLFEVTAEERLARAISKIYGSNVTATDAIEDDMTLEFGNGEVEEAYAIKEDGNYLVKATGTGGFSGGTVTLWVVVEISDDNKVDGVGKVVIDSNVGQSYINRVSDSHLEYFGDNFSSEESFNVSDWQLSSGPTVTLTATAIVNAVNTALEFVRTQLLGEVIVPDEPGPFEDFNYYSESYISDDTTVELAEDGTSVVFGIVANPYVFTSTFRMSITVDNTGTITAMTVPATPADGNGSTEGFESSMDENVLNASLYIGKTADEILDYLGGEPKDDFTYEDLKNNAVADNTITSGATYSNFIVTYSALFAASNYEVYAELIPLKLNQQMSEIYGGSVVVEAVSLDGLTATVGKGTVNTVYSVAGTDDYIVSATGNGGYENGTVTCWIVVETENGAVSGIGNVVIAGNEKQSFISYISDENLAHFGESFDGSDFELADWKNNNLTGGASMSTTAIINSVNIAKNFVSANLISGGENA